MPDVPEDDEVLESLERRDVEVGVVESPPHELLVHPLVHVQLRPSDHPWVRPLRYQQGARSCTSYFSSVTGGMAPSRVPSGLASASEEARRGMRVSAHFRSSSISCCEDTTSRWHPVAAWKAT
eukprot:762781-Hanusia_phi.AAC.5